MLAAPCFLIGTCDVDHTCTLKASTLHWFQGFCSVAAQADVEMEVTTRAYGLPQMWLFLYNSTRTAEALATVAPGLNLTVGAGRQAFALTWLNP